MVSARELAWNFSIVQLSINVINRLLPAKSSQLAHNLAIGGPAPIREMPRFADVYTFIYSGLSLAIQSSSTSCELGSYSYAI